MTNLQPDLSENPFLRLESFGKKDWERKAEIAAQIILIDNSCAFIIDFGDECLALYVFLIE